MALKNKLIKYIRDKFTQQWLRNQGDPAKVVSILEKINPNALMIGFCRRFATYKRAHHSIYRFNTFRKDCEQS